MHLNEGHPALAAFELLRAAFAPPAPPGTRRGRSWREQLVFTTHTPVPPATRPTAATRSWACWVGWRSATGDPERFVAVGRIDQDDPGQPSGMTVVGLRASRSANAVSRRHGEVARAMWQPLFPDRPVDAGPDRPRHQRRAPPHVAVGADAGPAGPAPRRRMARPRRRPGHLGRRRRHLRRGAVGGADCGPLAPHRACPRASHQGSAPARRGPQLRRGGAERPRPRSAHHRLRAPARHLQAPVPAVPAARPRARPPGRRTTDPVHLRREGPPLDEEAKRIVRDLFDLKGSPEVAPHVAFLEDYDLSLRGARWSPAATCGSTCPARRWRRAAPAA